MTSEPTRHRLPGKGVVLMIIESSKTILFLAALALFSGDPETLLLNAGVLLALIPATAVLGFLRWLRFQYWFEDGEFRVENGILFRQKTYIPLEKVQAVDATTGVLQRVLGLVKLEIKTGAAGSQATLAAVTQEEADRIRGLLRPGVVTTEKQDDIVESPRGRVFTLSPRQLMLAGATSGRLGVVAGFITWVLAQIDETTWLKLTESVDVTGAEEQLLQTNPLLVAGVVVAGLFVSWVGAVVWEVITYGRFEVFRQGDDVVVQRGLFERRQISLPAHRVQALRYHETLLRQPFGYGTLYVEAVGHSEDKGKTSSTLHPFISREQSRRLIAELLPKFNVDIEYIRPPKRALPRFLIKPSLVVGLPVAIAAWVWTPAALGLLLLPVIWLVGFVTWRDTGLSLGDEIAVVRGRKRLRRTTAILQRDTTQLVVTTSSLLQRRRDLASVSVTVATGPLGRTFTARDLDHTDAWHALQWVLATRSGTLPASFDASVGSTSNPAW